MSTGNLDAARQPEREEPGTDVLGFFARRKWLILFGLTVGLGLGYLKYLRDPPRFRSSGRVNVIKQHATLPVTGGSAMQPMNFRMDLRNDIELIMSEQIIRPAVEGHVFYDDQGNIRTQLSSLKDLRIFAGVSNPVGVVASGLRVSQIDQGSSVLVISFEGSNSEDGGKIINNIIRSYQVHLAQAYQSVAQKAIDLLSQANGELSNKLREAEQNLLDHQLNAPDGVSGDSNIHQTRMLGIETERSGLILRRRRLATQLRQIDEALAANYSRESILLMVQQFNQENETTSSSGQPRAFSIAQQIFPLLLEEADLLSKYAEEHPRVQGVRRRIEMTRSFLEENLPLEEGPRRRQDFLALFIQAMQLELSQIDAQLAALDELYTQEEAAARTLIEYRVTLQKLQGEQQRLQTMWQGVLTLMQQLDLTSDHGEYRAEVISWAGGGFQVAPNIYSSLPLGGILGLLVGIVLAVIAESADRSFKSPTEIASTLGLRVIGHTPIFPKAMKSKRDKSKLDPSLVAHFKPKSRTAESFRAIRTALYFSTRGNQYKIIQMTSPDPGDGKSTTCANVAVSIAQSGKRVLLIDCDMRRPRAHRLFGLSENAGLTSLLTSDMELTEAIQTTEVENLDCLPCGPKPDNPAELLTSSRFEELLAVLREKYDFVLLDTPPLLAVTDPSAVAARVDAVLLVLRISSQGRYSATQSVDILREMGANILGVVVNGAEGGGGYGYGGYGYMGYGKYEYGAYGSGGRRDKAAVYYTETGKR